MLFETLQKGVRRWWRIQSQVRELNHLDDAELNDLGIGRWQIPEIARRSVH